MGASTEATRALFSGIPSLKVLGGSPTTLSVHQAMVAFLELMFAAFGMVFPAEISAAATIYNAAETGGVVMWRRRETFEAASLEAQYAVDALSILGKTYLDIERAGRKRRRARRRSLVIPRRHASSDVSSNY
jgi:hypothetical protein